MCARSPLRGHFTGFATAFLGTQGDRSVAIRPDAW
jgi:hypothetical protein